MCACAHSYGYSSSFPHWVGFKLCLCFASSLTHRSPSLANFTRRSPTPPRKNDDEATGIDLLRRGSCDEEARHITHRITCSCVLVRILHCSRSWAQIAFQIVVHVVRLQDMWMSTVDFQISAPILTNSECVCVFLFDCAFLPALPHFQLCVGRPRAASV